MDEQTLFMVCIAGAVALGAFFLTRLFTKGEESKLRDRLTSHMEEAKPETGNKAKDIFQKIGTAAAKPFMPDTREKASVLRKKLSRAGIYTPAAIKTVTGMKVICLVGGLVGGYIAGIMSDNLLLGLSLGGLAGYMAPSMWLN